MIHHVYVRMGYATETVRSMYTIRIHTFLSATIHTHTHTHTHTYIYIYILEILFLFVSVCVTWSSVGDHVYVHGFRISDVEEILRLRLQLDI